MRQQLGEEDDSHPGELGRVRGVRAPGLLHAYHGVASWSVARSVHLEMQNASIEQGLID